jgi:GDP-L-fucose synthase
LIDCQAKIFVAGHNGLVGSAIVRKLKKAGYDNLVLRSSRELDLTNQQMTWDFFSEVQPEYVFMAAARVGGIMANSVYPAQFIYDNLMIEANVIHSAYKAGVNKLLFLGSSCIYPKLAAQPLKEDCLLTGPLEPTNEWYAIAKIAGIKLCQAYRKQYGSNFISVMPTNLYGPNDNFDLETSHVLPALLRKFHEAKVNGEKSVTVWGTGSPVREFLYIDDLADACFFLMNTYNGENIVNIGTGVGVTIGELAEKVKHTVGFEGNIFFDKTKPDGTPVKINDVSFLKELGWVASTDLNHGLQLTYDWYQQHQ